MSNCRVEKRVWKDPHKASDYTCLYYELDVEATPERGQQLHEGHWFSGPLASVIWNVDDAQFKCRVEDEVPYSDRDYEYTHDFLVQNALHEGWKTCDAMGLG